MKDETEKQVQAPKDLNAERASAMMVGILDALSIIGAMLSRDEEALAEMKALYELFIQTIPHRLQSQGLASPATIEGYHTALRHLFAQIEREQSVQTLPYGVQ